MNSKKNRTITKSKINFEILESITMSQRDASNWLLLYCAEKTVRKSNTINKERRKEQLNDYKEAIMPNFKYATDFKKLNSQWWNEEVKWYKKQSKNFKHEDMINALLYRLQVMFFRNHNNCFFYKETNGVRGGLKGASRDKLNQMQAEISLPLLLAIGRLQFENEDKKIPKLIYKTISKRLKEFEKMLKTLEKKILIDDFNDREDKKNTKKSISSVKQSVKLYKKAKDMSVSYDWLSGYDIYKDIYKEVKNWLS